jgi:hypothetical protein
MYVRLDADGEHCIAWHAWLLQEICTIWRRLPVHSRDGEVGEFRELRESGEFREPREFG